MTTILVIDDVEVSRYACQIFLEDMGITYAGAKDEQDALEKIQSQSIDGILLDWHLKKEDGITFIATLKDKKKGHIPVIIISGVESREKEQIAIKAGAKAFIEKPTTKENLTEGLKKAGIL